MSLLLTEFQNAEVNERKKEKEKNKREKEGATIGAFEDAKNNVNKKENGDPSKTNIMQHQPRLQITAGCHTNNAATLKAENNLTIKCEKLTGFRD